MYTINVYLNIDDTCIVCLVGNRKIEVVCRCFSLECKQMEGIKNIKCEG